MQIWDPKLANIHHGRALRQAFSPICLHFFENISKLFSHFFYEFATGSYDTPVFYWKIHHS